MSDIAHPHRRVAATPYSEATLAMTLPLTICTRPPTGIHHSQTGHDIRAQDNAAEALRTEHIVTASIDDTTGVADQPTWDHHARTALARRVAPPLTAASPTPAAAPTEAPTNVGLLIVDIDNFRAVAAQVGLPTADLVLRAVAQLLVTVATSTTTRSRTGDVQPQLPDDRHLVGRYGPDQFAVLLPGVSAEQAHRAGSRTCAQVEALTVTVTPPGRTVVTIHGVTVSVGIAVHRGVVVDPAAALGSMLTAAEGAVRAAKRAGKNRVRLAGPFGQH